MPGHGVETHELQALRVLAAGPTTRPGDSACKGWRAEINEAGRHYLEHNDYPPGHRFTRLDLTPIKGREPKPAPPPPEPNPRQRLSTPFKRHTRPIALPDYEVDSPASLRKRKPDQYGVATSPRDPWDDRILVTVKEAAWLLSVSEGAIRRAVQDGDLMRVFIGAETGTTGSSTRRSWHG